MLRQAGNKLGGTLMQPLLGALGCCATNIAVQAACAAQKRGITYALYLFGNVLRMQSAGCKGMGNALCRSGYGV